MFGYVKINKMDLTFREYDFFIISSKALISISRIEEDKSIPYSPIKL